jgi:CRP-like cAMP-binding protein
VGKSKLEDYLRLYNEGKVIYEEGEVGDTVFLIKSGKVDVFKGSGMDERKLATLGAGELVGELALEEGEHERSATVKAATKVEGWRFPGPAFETLIEKKQEFRQKLIRALVDRLMETTNRLADQESSELIALNQLLIQSSHCLLSDLSSEELENDEASISKTVTHSDEMLAFRFNVDPDVIEDFRSLSSGGSIEDFEDERRIDLSNFAQSVVEQTTEKLEIKYPEEGSVDEELVDGARTLKNLLAKLEDYSESYEKDELQAMMEKRREVEEIVNDRKEKGRSDYLIGRMVKLLRGVKQEINIHYD